MPTFTKVRYILFGMALMLLLSNVIIPAFAGSFTTQITVLYDDIRVVCNGVQIDMDGAGNPVKPFMLNGATYLPARVIGEALNGGSTYWEADSHTLYLGPKPDKITGEIRLQTIPVPNMPSDAPKPATAEETEAYLLGGTDAAWRSVQRLEAGNAVVQCISPGGIPHASVAVYVIDRSGNLYILLNDRPFINGWGSTYGIVNLQYDGQYIRFDAETIDGSVACWVDVSKRRIV